ncbi:MAG: bifunctional 5,10-methylenetetrahydrofolate dehydrogenase/5,10-methenyltetrahydrofolate cyclohydrolase [Patescibacteria group bacterium]
MIIDGKKIAQKIKNKIRRQLKNKRARPGLAVILIGDNPASLSYIKQKKIATKYCFINFKLFHFNNTAPEKLILKTISNLNKNKKINGIVVQLPLPKKFNTQKIIDAIDPEKDVDGFRLKSRFSSPTHQAIIKAIQSTGENLNPPVGGKIISLVGKKSIFTTGLEKRLIKLFPKSKIKLYSFKYDSSAKIKKGTKIADVVIVALGEAEWLKSNMIKRGVIIIDVGFNKKNNAITGDVSKNVYPKAKHYTPVPGGIGPMTVAYLINNVFKSFKCA